MVIEEAIVKLVNKEDLTPEMAEDSMNEIMSGEVPSEIISAYLIALQQKGATDDEIGASARGMRGRAKKLKTDLNALEIVGTGGDKANTFNISTASAIVASAAGVPVAKHGNRAATSKCGTADCLEALGVNIKLEPEKMAEVFNKIKICFMFAQVYHTSMKYVAPVRKALPVPTVFNILGPLTNPACPKYQLLGVYKENMVEPLTHVLSNIGVERAMTVFGNDGLDEISACGPTTVCELNRGSFTSYVIKPEDFGMESCKKSDLVGGTPEENAKILKDILNGEKGPKRNAVLLNAGAAIHLAKDIPMEEGIKIAADMIDSGKAMDQLDAFIRETNL
ncbi:MAG: anthranilate phosphoribosyltransferase [Lachnospiraceae bacterium]|nr:anthranilate phosphoribosyltransferase [Lachnospiraceae bacterium]